MTASFDYKSVFNYFCITIAAILLAIGVFVYDAPIKDIVILTTFILVYVQLPGMLIASWVGIDKPHLSTFLAMGLFSGWLLTVVCYFVADILGNNLPLYIVGPLMSAIFLYKHAFKNGMNRIKVSNLSTAFCLFAVLVLLYCLLGTQYIYLSPSTDDLIIVNPDKAFHMGLINSLSHDYPLQSMWFKGAYFYYHIFTEIIYSIPVRLFGVSADSCFMSFNPLLTAYAVTLSFYAFFREISSKPRRSGLYCLIFILSNIYIAKDQCTSLVFTHILGNDNAAGYAIAALLIFIVTFSKWYDSYISSNPGHWKILLLSALLIMLITGLKGPIGALIIASLWGTFILGVILRRIKIRAILPVMIITAGFLLVYMTVLGAKGQVNTPGGATLELASMADFSFWKGPLAALLKSRGIPKLLRMTALMIVYLVFFFTVYLVPFFAGYVRELVLVMAGKKEYNPAMVLIYAACLVGMVAMFVLSYSGHSQVYFGLVTAALAPAVACRFIEDLEEEQNDSKAARSVLRFTIGIMSISLIVTGLSLASCYSKGIDKAIKYSNPSKKHNEYLSISRGEWEAMNWLRANTDNDALISGDRYYSVSPEAYDYTYKWDNRFFMYEVYSNRFSYLSGSAYILHKEDHPMRKLRIENTKKLHDEEYKDRGKLAHELGIDYVVVSKRFNGAPNLENSVYKKCFSNEDVDIYEIES